MTRTGWAQVPDETEILLTHAPPHGRGDRTLEGDEAGSRTLRERVDQLVNLGLR